MSGDPQNPQDFDSEQRIETLERELLAAQSALAESRRANAMLREALQGARLALPVLQTMLRAEKLAGPDIAEAMARRADYVLSASAADHKAWEDALWGEPAGQLVQNGWQPSYFVEQKQFARMSFDAASFTSLYAKPKGLK